MNKMQQVTESNYKSYDDLVKEVFEKVLVYVPFLLVSVEFKFLLSSTIQYIPRTSAIFVEYILYLDIFIIIYHSIYPHTSRYCTETA